MDRNKTVPGTRGPKAKITQQPPNHFIALGAKQSSPRDDPKRPVPLPTVSSHLASSSKAPVDKLKREGSSTSLPVPPSKKLKASIAGTRSGISVPSGSGLLSSIDRITGGQNSVEPWEALAVDCEATELFETVMNCIQNGNMDKAVGIILGVIRTVRSHRSKICKIVYSSLFLICSCKPTLYSNDNIVNAMLSVLRRDVNAGVKGANKSNSYIHMLFINLLTHSFCEILHWPEQFLKLYVEDAVTDRVFIDNPYCKPFVDNIITAFNTKVPPTSLLKSETWSSAARDTSSPLTIHNAEEDDVFSEHKAVVETWSMKVYPRYTQAQEKVEQIVLEVIKEQLARRQQPEAITKNFVRFLSTACGLVEIRIITVSRIETWLHNHKLMKPAQELLAYLCYNCSASSQRDLEVIVQLSKLRLKNKPMVTYFNNCLKEMVCSFPENLYPLMKYTIYNELSNARNTNNLIVVGALFQVAQQASADAFADICLELLLNKDDYLRSLRALLKEINRVLRNDFNLLTVVQSLLRERKELTATIRDHEFRERIFISLADLVCMCMLLCVSPQVRDAATQSKRDITVLKSFQRQVRDIQKECVSWLHDSALRIYRPSISDFPHVLLKLLFLEQAEHYYKVDSWPGENERNLFLRLVSEVPVHQATLIRILLIGISKEHPIPQGEVIEIVDQVIKRAANLPQDCEPPLVVDKIEIIDFFFNLCSYNYPDNIILPASYVPPKLAISSIYWKTWLMLLIISAHNPLTFGSVTWNKYPMLRMFMEMCITNHFSFPPPTMITEDDYQVKEQQIIVLEKQKILEFESHLAAATSKMEVTEQSSLLLPQVMELNPQGDVRRPPQQVFDQLQSLNNTHRLGHLLCRSRCPDFLLDIMSRQGGTAHMPWLAELVHSSEGVLAHLPVQCLCEYLLSTAPTEKLTKHGQLLAHLRTIVHGNDPNVTIEVLEYLFRRLTSDHSASRTQSTKALALILAPSEDIEVSVDNSTIWLTKFIPHFIHFQVIKPTLITFLRQSLLIETNPARVSSYMNFLSTQDMSESYMELNELVTDLSSVIIERHSVASHVLPGENNETLKNLLQIFTLHVQKSKENAEESYNLLQNYNGDYFIVNWATGEQCAMQAVVIHSAVVLLTYGPLDNCPHFQALLNIWFPDNSEHPRAYSPDTSETTSFLPDWMKLRMIRSNVSTLVDAAIEKLEPPKLVLFIQSFGIPTTSISKLLYALDKVTLVDPKLVVDSVLDKAYMIQLVDVQNTRGAKGGETFIKAIEMQMPIIQDVKIDVELENKKPLPTTISKTLQMKAEEDDIIKMLNELYYPNFTGDKNNLILMILKAVSIRKNLVESVFNFLNSVPVNYTIPLALKFSSFTSLLQLVFTQPSAIAEKITYARKLLKMISVKNHCLTKLLQTFLNSNKSGELAPKTEVSMDPIEILKSSNIVTDKKLETVFVSEEDLGMKLGKILLEGDTSTLKKTGLAIDWLSAIELEIVQPDKPKLQLELLFSLQKLAFRPLLLSLVLQRATWKSLHGIMSYLLKECTPNICPISALDFLTALSQSPKLWQGRDKAIPKHHHYEDVLQLKRQEATVLIKYVLEEAKLCSSGFNWKKNMETRLQLLLKCIGQSATSIVKFLNDQADTDIYARELLLMIYMSLPYSGQTQVYDSENFSEEIYSKICPSAVDEISHCILSALAATPRTKDWSKKSQDLELCARKLASCHPILVLRQLPMLAGCLKGRAQYEWGVLKGRGHLLLFTQVFGIVELLQPHIFKHHNILSDLLDSYFMLLQFHGHNKDLNFLVGRIVVFMQNWLVKDVKTASKYLQDNGGVLNDIQYSQPRVRPLLSNVSLPITEQGLAPSELLVGTVTPPVPEQHPQHWPQVLIGLQSTESLNALQELDHITNKRPQLLDTVSQHLYSSLSSPNGSTRALALILIVRWLKYNPKAAKDALPSILACLDSNNGDIVNSVLERLSDLVTVMQEYAKVILTRVFLLGMKSTLNTTSNITKSINLLSLQYGC